MDNVRYSKLAKNTILFGSANFITKFTQYIIISLLSYRLTTSQYGISDIVIQTSTILIPIISCDIASSLFRFGMDKAESKKDVFSNSFFVIMIGFLVWGILYPILSQFEFAGGKLTFIYLLTFSQILQLAAKEFVRSIGKLRLYVVSGLVNSIVQIATCLLFVYMLDMSLDGYLLSSCLSYIAEFLFCFLFAGLFRYIDFGTINRISIKKLLKYSIPLAPNSIMWWITAVSNRYFILGFEGEAATGVYAVAAKIPALITIATGFFFQAWQISAVEAYDSKDKDLYYTKIFNYLNIFTTIMICAVLIILKPLVAILVAEEFRSAWIYAPLLVFGTLFNTLQSFIGTNYTASKNTLGALKSTILMSAINLLLNYFLIKKIGIQGASFATLISYIFVCIYRFIDTRKYVKIELEYKKISFSLILLIIVLIFSFYPNMDSTSLSLVCFCLLILINAKDMKEFISYFLKMKRKPVSN